MSQLKMVLRKKVPNPMIVLIYHHIFEDVYKYNRDSVKPDILNALHEQVLQGFLLYISLLFLTACSCLLSFKSFRLSAAAHALGLFP